METHQIVILSFMSSLVGIPLIIMSTLVAELELGKAFGAGHLYE